MTQQQNNISASSRPPRPKSPHFPPHNAPRVWFITAGPSPIAIALAKQVLDHGDYVVAGVHPLEFERREGQSEDFRVFLEDVKKAERWRERLRVVGLDGRYVAFDMFTRSCDTRLINRRQNCEPMSSCDRRSHRGIWSDRCCAR